MTTTNHDESLDLDGSRPTDTIARVVARLMLLGGLLFVGLACAATFQSTSAQTANPAPATASNAEPRLVIPLVPDVARSLEQTTHAVGTTLSTALAPLAQGTDRAASAPTPSAPVHTSDAPAAEAPAGHTADASAAAQAPAAAAHATEAPATEAPATGHTADAPAPVSASTAAAPTAPNAAAPSQVTPAPAPAVLDLAPITRTLNALVDTVPVLHSATAPLVQVATPTLQAADHVVTSVTDLASSLTAPLGVSLAPVRSLTGSLVPTVTAALAPLASTPAPATTPAPAAPRGPSTAPAAVPMPPVAPSVASPHVRGQQTAAAADSPAEATPLVIHSAPLVTADAARQLTAPAAAASASATAIASAASGSSTDGGAALSLPVPHSPGAPTSAGGDNAGAAGYPLGSAVLNAPKGVLVLTADAWRLPGSIVSEPGQSPD